MKRFSLPALLAIAVLGCVPSANAAVTITVRGGWVNDAPAVFCNPSNATVGPGVPPSAVTLRCLAGALFDGSFMGHSIATTVQTARTSLSVTGTIDAWLYGMYWVDGSVGGLHYKGSYSISSADGSFTATTTIVGGTCDFAGSTGTLNFSGYTLNGGYSGSWILPVAPNGYTPGSPCVTAPTIP